MLIVLQEQEPNFRSQIMVLGMAVVKLVAIQAIKELLALI